MPNGLNVLFVPFDDLRPQLGCYGHSWIHSPNIDKFARESFLLERAYCQQAVCAPSRASLLTGCRPDTTGIFGLRTPVRSAMPEVLTLPEHFRHQNYETVSVGKVYHHGNDDLQGWDNRPYRPSGDWKGRGYLTDEAMEAIEVCDAQMEALGNSRRGLGPAFEAANVPDEAYQDGQIARAAIAHLRRLERQNNPFFLAVGFLKPHLPFCAPDRYWDLYDRSEIPLASNPFPPENVPDFSLTNFGELRGYFGMPEEGPIPDEQARKLIHGYAACVSYVDAQFGRLMDELKNLDLYDETIVVLWGDHGWKLGEHACWCKHTNFEIDARAPLIISAPDQRGEARRTNELVEFVDLYPTLCELTEIETPQHCEGTSFAPLMTEPNRPWKRAAFSQYPRGDIMGYTMRTDKYRYTEWQDENTGSVVARELYDHERDPEENVNRAGHDGYENLIGELSHQLNAGWEKAQPPGLEP
ncbi:MAG: sulfatase [Planctomycetota bacterium]